MTQIPSKSSSSNDSNGRTSDSKLFQVNGITSATNYSSDSLESYPELPAIPLPKIKQIEPKASAKGLFLQGLSTRSWWRLASLRTKAMALALAIGTVPVVLVGATAYFAASQGLYEQIVQNERVNANDLQDKLNIFIKQLYDNTVLMSQLNLFSNPKTRNLFTPEEKSETLERYRETFQVFDNIAIFDLKGNVQYQSGNESIPNAREANVLWYQKVVETGRPFIEDPRPSKSSKIYSLFIAAPVVDKSTGQLLGVLRTRLPMTALDQVFGIKDTREREYVLLDSENEIAASNEEKLIQKTLNQALPQLATQIKQKGEQPLTTVFSRENKEGIYSYFPAKELAQGYGLKWGLVVSRPTEVAFAPQRQLFLTLLLGTGATAVLVAAIAAFIANRATRPILDAAEAVDKIGQGELNTRLEIAGEDELAQLGGNINGMAQQLGAFVQEQALSTERAGLLAKVTGSRALNSQELNELFGQILDDVRKNLSADRIILYRFTPDGSGEIATESLTRGWSSASSSKMDRSFISEQQLAAYKQGRIEPIDNLMTAELDPERSRFMDRLEVQASAEIPVLHEGQPYGLLMVHYCGAPHQWQPSELNFLKQLAAQMGLSLDRVILLEQTEQLAKEQRQLKEGLQKRALELLQEVDPISKGDLTIRAKVTADEIGTIADSYNATVGNLRKIVLQVQQAASQVAQTTSTNEASVQTLSVEALRQAEQIAAALSQAQEMAQSVRLVAANAEQALAAVQQSSETVQEGDIAMNRTVDGILAIRETVAETAKKVKHLGESSQKISTVVNLISTFAAQTNLLALNASIEAARAGEEGRGFAVVADEVRSLARQSAEATNEIEKLVAAIQGETNEVVAAMEAGTEQVVMGTHLVDETRQSLNKITAASSQIGQLVEAIAQATVVQSQASQTVTETMTNVAAIASKTSQEATFVSSSFEELLKVARSLQEDVGQFKVS